MNKLPCKSCGSDHFGSYRNPDNSLTRTCHGYNPETGVPCAVKWHDSEDWKHFGFETKKRYATKEDYDRAYARWRKRHGKATGAK